MHFTNIIIGIVGFMTSIVYSIHATPIESFEITQPLDLQNELDLFVESNFDDHEVGLYYELMDMFNDGLNKRDDATEQTIGNILLAVNSSGIIWDLLDSIADSPERTEWLLNLTNNLLTGQNITLSLSSLTAPTTGDSLLGSLVSQLNISAIYDAVQASGLVSSLLDGLLLDTSFRPYLVDLIDRIVLSQKNLLLYLFAGILSKRDTIEGEDIFDIIKRAESQSINTAQLASLFAAASAEQNSNNAQATTTQQQSQQTQSINTAQLASLFAAASAEQNSAASSTTGTPSRPTGQNSESITSARSSASSIITNIQSRASASSSIESSSRATASQDTRSSSLSGTSTTSSVSNAYAGSLESFAANAGGAIVSSPVVGSIAEDFLNALNDTGFAVYFVKRFIATESYVNLTADILDTVMQSGAFHIDFSGLNITALVGDALSDPAAIVTFVGSLLTGDSSLIQTQIATYWGRYGTALQAILTDLEAKGLFAELNQYIFGDGSTSISSRPASTATTSSGGSTRISASVSTQNRNVVTSTTSSIPSSTSKTQNKASNSATNLNPLIYAQALLFGAVAFIFI